MSLAAHLAELSEKHRVLERKIEEAMAHPSTDAAEITRLKREKLKLKDAIKRIDAGTRH
jgi:hypothetical protein